MKHAVIDIGGSNIKSAVVGEDYNIIYREETPTPSDQGDFSDLINSLIYNLARNYEIVSVTVGVPGLVDYQAQTVINCPNLKFQIEKLISIVPLFIANDADLALLGEITLRGLDGENVAIVTLGTGVGGAFSIAGKAPNDFQSSGEIGHMKVITNGRQCSCSGRGCLEAYCSGWAIIKEAKIRISQDISSVKQVFDLIENGNAEAISIIDEMSEVLGAGIANLVNILGVEYIFLAGQISKSSPKFMSKLTQSARENVFLLDSRKLVIEQSCGIDSVALVGGAKFAKSKMPNE